RRHEPAAAVFVMGDIAEQVARLVAFAAAPRDVLVVIADDRGFLDHAGGCAGEHPADVVEAPHLARRVVPPMTTLITSWADEPNMRNPKSSSRHSTRVC